MYAKLWELYSRGGIRVSFNLDVMHKGGTAFGVCVCKLNLNLNLLNPCAGFINETPGLFLCEWTDPRGYSSIFKSWINLVMSCKYFIFPLS